MRSWCVVGRWRAFRVALATDKLAGATDEVRMLRDELASRDGALTLVNAELTRVRRHTEQLNSNYQTALQKYDNQQSVTIGDVASKLGLGRQGLARFPKCFLHPFSLPPVLAFPSCRRHWSFPYVSLKCDVR